MEQIGYSIIDSAGNELKFFGDTKGQLVTPDMLLLPNGDQVHCASAGDTFGDYRYVERWISDNRPSQWHAEVSREASFDGTRVVVTVTYEDNPSLFPSSVTPRQARLALSQVGLLPQVNMMIRAADETTQITWDYATTINRDDPLIIALGSALSLTEAQINALFVKASTL